MPSRRCRRASISSRSTRRSSNLSQNCRYLITLKRPPSLLSGNGGLAFFCEAFADHRATSLPIMRPVFAIRGHSECQIFLLCNRTALQICGLSRFGLARQALNAILLYRTAQISHPTLRNRRNWKYPPPSGYTSVKFDNSPHRQNARRVAKPKWRYSSV